MKAWKIIAAVVAVLVIGFVVFLLTFDIGKYKGVIEQQAKAATGRDVAIGSIKMGLSLTPTIVMSDVSVGNAPWGSRPQMMTIKSIAAKAELLPLLSKQVNISSIKLDGADMLLETDKDGKANWEFGATAPQDNASAGQQSSMSVAAINGSNLNVVMKDAKTGSEIDTAVKSMSMRLTGPMQEMNVANFTMNDATVSRKDAADNIQATIGKIVLESSGPIANANFKKVDVENIKVTGKNGGNAVNAEVAKLTLDDKGALDLVAKYNGGDITAKGTMSGIQGLRGNAKKELPMKLALEGMGLKGDVDLVVDAAQTPPFVKGSITIPELDLAKFSGGTTPTAGPAAPAARPEPAKPQAASAQPMFSNEPLPWDSLQGTNADVKVTIGTLKLASGQTVTNVSLPIKLSKGVLAMNGASLEMAGGTIQGNVDANAGAKSVAVKGSVKNMTAEALAKAYKRGDVVTGGPIDVALDVHGSGVSPHAIAATLSGSLLATMGESKISNKAMNMGSILQVMAAANPLAKQEPYTVATCAVANFQIANGVATTQNGVALMTDKVKATGSGKIDLGQDHVDMIIKPTVSGAVGATVGNLVSTVKVNGTMEAPNVGIDAASTAKAVAGLAAGIATGGAAGGLIGLNGSGNSQNGGGGLLGGLTGKLGGKKQQDEPAGTKTAAAAPAGDICAAARNWKH